MVYECENCAAALPPGVTACPQCGKEFGDAVPADAEMPRAGWKTRGDKPSIVVPPPVNIPPPAPEQPPVSHANDTPPPGHQTISDAPKYQPAPQTSQHKVLRTAKAIITSRKKTFVWLSSISSVAILIYLSDGTSSRILSDPSLFLLTLIFTLIIVLPVAFVISSFASNWLNRPSVPEWTLGIDATCCTECGQVTKLLHAVDFHVYSCLIYTFMQSSRRGWFCVSCVKCLASNVFWETAKRSILFPPAVVWSWFETRSIIKRVSRSQTTTTFSLPKNGTEQTRANRLQ